MSARVAIDLTLHDVNATGKEIGRGAYGRVFEYSHDDALHKITTDFLNECQIWSTIRHPCIVQFLGVYYPARDQYKLPVMVMEKMQRSLRGLVENYTNIPLNVKLTILDEVCLGLRYLHSRNPPIVHRDLTPNNVLLGDHLEAKITDLGVAKVMLTDSKMTMTTIPGTPDFMPPEALTKRPVYGPPLDIFSYGGVILNVITQQWPEPTDQLQFSAEYDRFEVVSEVARRQKYVNMFTREATDLVPLVTSCLADNSKKRPSVMQVSIDIKRVKDMCSQLPNRDGISPIVWWAEVSGQSSPQQVTSLTTQLEEKNNVLIKENDDLKVEVSDLKLEIDDLEVEIKELKSENNNLKADVDSLNMENTHLRTENKQLKHAALMDDHNGSLKPPVPPRSRAVPRQSKQHVVPAPQNKDTNKSSREQWEYSHTTDLPVNIKWHEGASAPVVRAFHTALLCDKKVYVGGGFEDGKRESTRIDVYTPANNSWSPSPINTPYCLFAMATLNNQLVIAGGKDRSNKLTNKLLLLDNDQFKKYTRMGTPRYNATSAGHQGTLIVAGGKDEQYRRLLSTEVFNSTTRQWCTTDVLPLPYYRLQSVILDNVIHLLGGSDQDGNASSTVFSAPLDTLPIKWSSDQDTPWCNCAAVSMQSKHLLAIGGTKKAGKHYLCTRDIHVLNKVSHCWEVIGQIPSERSGPAAVSIVDSNIVIVGGYDGQYTNTVWIGSCELQ
ncbi:serine/threonine-protein kinase WNK-like isoform X2 [Dysidea avara]|uniref:serine/threonine-protein kinase WNK-like isoform X2 n=1 Tax=Dysidea avara TaxID=196820 RepID=UPI003324E7B8